MKSKGGMEYTTLHAQNSHRFASADNVGAKIINYTAYHIPE